MYKTLSANLEKLIAGHKDMLALAEKKRDVIISGQIDGLQALLQEESNLMEQLADLEQERLTCVREMVPTSADAKQVTLSQLLGQMSEQDRDTIQGQMKELLHIIEQLKQENAQNEMLVRDSLSHVQHTLNVLTVSPTEDYLYHPKEQQTEPKGTSGLFDRKA